MYGVIVPKSGTDRGTEDSLDTEDSQTRASLLMPVHSPQLALANFSTLVAVRANLWENKLKCYVMLSLWCSNCKSRLWWLEKVLPLLHSHLAPVSFLFQSFWGIYPSWNLLQARFEQPLPLKLSAVLSFLTLNVDVSCHGIFVAQLTH